MANENTTPEQTEPQVDETASLKDKLSKSEQQRDELLRTLAEYENARQRGNRDLELERKFAHGKFVVDLLPALDNLDRALIAATESGESTALVKGVLATQAQLLAILKQHAVTPIEALGQPFDPNLHQAVQMQPSDEFAPNIVSQVLQRGFMIHDRVLRPASVVIATSK